MFICQSGAQKSIQFIDSDYMLICCLLFHLTYIGVMSIMNGHGHEWEKWTNLNRDIVIHAAAIHVKIFAP